MKLSRLATTVALLVTAGAYYCAPAQTTCQNSGAAVGAPSHRSRAVRAVTQLEQFGLQGFARQAGIPLAAAQHIAHMPPAFR